MSQLEPPTQETTESSTEETKELSVDGVTASVTIPDDATEPEAVALAAAVGAHLTDRQQAAIAVAAADDGVERTDQWVLADRMRSQGRRHWPRDVERGDEWRAAARSF